jgi:two-component system sensor histidine kinase ChvG
MQPRGEAPTADAGLTGPASANLPQSPPRQIAGPAEQVRRRGFLSPITRRILAINAIAPALLVGAVLYLDQYRAGLIDARVDSLYTQGQLIAGALGESALTAPGDTPTLNNDTARQILRRLADSADTRARLFDAEGNLIADSRVLQAAGRNVVSRVLPPPEQPGPGLRLAEAIYNWIIDLVPEREDLPLYDEGPEQEAADYQEAIYALGGDAASAVRLTSEGVKIISVAVPVQGLRKVLGALMLNTDSRDIDNQVRTERLIVLKLFCIVLGVTALLSAFLAGTIARPIHHLARAADRVRRLHGRRISIPDFTARRDEIGDLSGALSNMTESLYSRLDAIEAFAADVAHELKNPLTSLRSAVETVERTNDPEKRRRLMQIIADDVQRLDRLISDISNASRLDAELSRAVTEPVDLARLLGTVIDLHRETAELGGPRFELDLAPRELFVPGLESRLGQVVRNLLDNAMSFSPPGGTIRIALVQAGRMARISVEDAGPGIPADKLEAIFDRFYSERPVSEQFGKHSGLGLSISRQIVLAHGGRIRAENRQAPDGKISGARFIVELPVD